jgi:hypothetical protein
MFDIETAARVKNGAEGRAIVDSSISMRFVISR